MKDNEQMTDKSFKVVIDDYNDRSNTMLALIRAGYSVEVHKWDKPNTYDEHYQVVANYVGD